MKTKINRLYYINLCAYVCLCIFEDTTEFVQIKIERNSFYKQIKKYKMGQEQIIT